MKKDDFDIDYKQLSEDTGKALKNVLQQQELYLELLERISGNGDVIGAVAGNSFKMNMTDQIKYMQATAILIEVCTQLNEKYGFGDATEEEE